jgi:hypothetical protein
VKPLLLALPVFLLFGCAAPKTEVVRVVPPVTFVTPLAVPEAPKPGSGATVEDMVDFALECRAVLRMCTTDRDLLFRFYYED